MIFRKLMIQLDTRCSVSLHHEIPLIVLQEEILIAKSIKEECVVARLTINLKLELDFENEGLSVICRMAELIIWIIMVQQKPG